MQERLERVPFPKPVHVSFLAGGAGLGEQSVRVEAENLSHGGMFVRTEERPEIGSSVSVGLEARGKIFPFAEGEVVWAAEPEESVSADGRGPGFGVRFTKFLNPRSTDLIEHIFERAHAPAEEPVAAPAPAAAPKPEPVVAAPAPSVVARPIFSAPLHSPPPPPRGLLSQPIADLTPRAEAPVLHSELDREQDAPEVVDSQLDEDAYDARAEADADAVADAAEEEDHAEPLRASPVLDPRSRLIAAGGVFALLVAAALGGVLAAQYSVSKQQPEEGRQIIAAPPPPAAMEDAASEGELEELLAEAPVPAPVVEPAPVAPAPAAPAMIAAPSPAPAPAPVVARPQKVAAPAPAPAPRPAAQPQKSGSARLASGGAREVSWKQSGNSLEVTVTLAEGARIDRAFALNGPSRLVIDLDRVKPQGSSQVKGDGSLVQTVRVGARDGGTRLVLDLARPVSGAEAKGRTVRATLAR